MVDARRLSRFGPTAWHYDDPVANARIRSAIMAHGQLFPLLVRRHEESYQVVYGWPAAKAICDLGIGEAMVIDLGDISDQDAVMAALAAEVRQDVDYARLAMSVSWLLDNGVTADRVASQSPFDRDRVEGFGRLSRFDWAEFSKPAGNEHQGGLWDEEQ